MANVLKLIMLPGVAWWCGCSPHGPSSDSRAQDESPAQAAPRPADTPLEPGVTEGFRLSASLVSESHVIPVTAPILLRVRIENASHELLRFLRTTPERDIDLLVTAEGGQPVPLTLHGQDLRAQDESGVHYGQGLRQFKPGAGVETVLQVDRTHDMSLVGKYHIQAVRAVPRRDRPEEAELVWPTARVSSEVIEVEVAHPPMHSGSVGVGQEEWTSPAVKNR